MPVGSYLNCSYYLFPFILLSQVLPFSSGPLFLGLLDSLKRYLHSAFEQNSWIDYPPDDYYEDMQELDEDSDSDYYDAQLVQNDDEKDDNHDEENDAYIIRPDESQKVYSFEVL